MLCLNLKNVLPAIRKSSCQPSHNIILPYQWASRHTEFINTIQKKFDTLTSQYIAAINGKNNTAARITATMDIVHFLEATKALCQEKGIYYATWFEIHINNACDDRETLLDRRKAQLTELINNRDYLIKQDRINAEWLPGLSDKVQEYIKENDGTLQTDVYRHFPCDLRPDISEIIYQMAQSGKINRARSGRTYTLFSA